MKKYLKRDQLKLYKIIWDRFTASQMASAIMENVSVDIQAGDYLFRATDSKVKFPGYLKIYNTDDSLRDEKNRRSLPELTKGEELKIHEYRPKQHFTQPPPAYTEASLIKTLEEKGIGRPSTYAPIVDTIQKEIT
jgi:DNA topoisomerase I